MRYSCRTSLVEREKTCELTEDGLVVREGERRLRRIAYADVRGVSLQFCGTACGVTRYRCVIAALGGKLVLTNCHFVSLAHFEERDEAYRRFVADLHDRLAPYAEGIRFRRGSSALFVSAVVFALLMPPLFVLALWLVLVEGERLSAGGRASLLTLPGMFACFVIPILTKGRPGAYDPRSLPNECLPGTGTRR